MAIVQCTQCGANIKRDAWSIRNNSKWFCDNKCRNAWQRVRSSATCANCGVLFERPQSHLRGRRAFCSLDCRLAWQRARHVQVPCDNCGAEIQKETARAGNSRHHFCNHRCKAEWQSKHKSGANHNMWRGGKITVICAACGKEHQRFPKDAKGYKNLFCNRACHSQWLAVNKTFSGANNPKWKGGRATLACDNCGDLFQKDVCVIRTFNFCSRACMGTWKSIHQSGPNHPQWIGGHIEYRGPNWKQQAQAARKRDGYKCHHCGKTQKQNGRSLDVHHIQPFRTFGYVPNENDNYLQANELVNLISLCRRCHKRAEWGAIPLQMRFI